MTLGHRAHFIPLGNKGQIELQTNRLRPEAGVVELLKIMTIIQRDNVIAFGAISCQLQQVQCYIHMSTTIYGITDAGIQIYQATFFFFSPCTTKLSSCLLFFISPNLYISLSYPSTSFNFLFRLHQQFVSCCILCFGVILRRLKFLCRHFGTLCFILVGLLV